MKASPQIVIILLSLLQRNQSEKRRSSFEEVSEVNHVAIYKWIKKYVKLMKKYVDQLVPKISGIWRSGEMDLNIKNLDNHDNSRQTWKVMDNQSRF